MDRATQSVLGIARLKSRYLSNRKGIALQEFSPHQRSSARAGVSFLRRPQSGQRRLTRKSSLHQHLRRGPYIQRFPSQTARQICRWINEVGAGWHQQKKGVPSQPNVQTGFLRAAVPPLLSCHRMSPRLSSFPSVVTLRIAPSMKQCASMIAQTSAWRVRSLWIEGPKTGCFEALRTEGAQRMWANGNS